MLEDLQHRLPRLAEAFRANEDDLAARSMEALLHKLEQQELGIAFCGHISGGKSALINQLIGQDILPSRPTPSSANVVTVRPGTAPAQVHSRQGVVMEFDLQTDLNDVQAHCLDGEQIEHINIHVPFEQCHSAVSLVDTPGINTIDGARRLAEDPALIAADAVFYVMDYNHVQSEVNFRFTKYLKERGKPVFLVINQIDKHCDFELDFSYFKRSSLAGFTAWGIEPDGLFFTSVTEPEHPENQWNALKQQIQALFQHQADVISATVYTAARQLVDDHVRRLANKNADARQADQALLDQCADLEQTIMDYNQLRQKINEQEQRPVLLQEALEAEIRHVIDNARLTPFAVTQLVEKYIESRSPGFKVGFLFSGDKTRKEIEQRQAALYQELQQQASTQLEWHLRDTMAKTAEAQGLTDSAYMEATQAFRVTWEPSLIDSVLRDGATLSQEYVHNFTRDLANAIKAVFRREALALADEAVLAARRQSTAALAILTPQAAPLTEVVEALHRLEKAEQENRREQQRLTAMLSTNVGPIPVLQDLLKFRPELDTSPLSTLGQAIQSGKTEQTSDTTLAASSTGATATTTSAPSTLTPSLSPSRSAEGQSADGPAPSPSNSVLATTAATLRHSAEIIAPLPGFDHLSDALAQRADRLAANRFTVALFGAFSAGKSSVANALLGQMVLPVSPNPTTAAINKILPPTADHPHGSVCVQLKSFEDITTDVINALKACDQEATSLDEALQKIDRLTPMDIHPSAKPHYSFLLAVVRGLRAVREHLGRQLMIHLDEFNDYVASEEKACFVEWIELHYDCPMTRHGIMLVDTPGADSINARHTGVAFDYIKSADAVLFVTYYNSAFSHADRDFLMQLGRVKDTFAMDKMFFLVNAADLAKTGDELQEVVTHVTERVNECGIRNPRIYAVSSQAALLARLAAAGPLTASLAKTYLQRCVSLNAISTGEACPPTAEACPAGKVLTLSGFERLEEDFYHFTLHDLTGIAVTAAQGELQRCLSSLDEMIAAAHSDAGSRRIKRATYEATKGEIHHLLQSARTANETQRLHQEVAELLYYVKQRLFYRFGDIFGRYFNPAVLQDARGAITKKALQHNFSELLLTMERELAQELRATTLRTETYIHRRAEQFSAQLAQQIALKVPQCPLSPYEPQPLQTSALPGDQFAQAAASAASLLGQIKNPKDFFEGSGRHQFRQALEDQLQAPADAYIAAATEQMRTHYSEELQRILATVLHNTGQQIDDYFASLTAALSVDFDVAKAEAIQQELARAILA
ncbi:dynamin family protein [Heliophilum fasciatum]|uniref:Dynamin family protein n=1 Tax=Heliophilum fasciatum TaxID=35700 RepID=A0A4R2RM25_9FIRM|nr:dynamin family protein [Heliophilum fasciatum]MCW2279213.1 putative GTPase [Heliophilum fasciatum]TCP60801.1 dynamin family protein [Heliophilum fasciatum]